MQHWIFVTGGVVSGLGKGIVTASLGVLLADAGKKVGFCKIDPYLNADAGTLSPTEHGETYVLDDGTECDLDLGHYERFSGRQLNSLSSVTAGQIYRDVTKREREGSYCGATVQVVPHVTNEIMARFRDAAVGSDVCLIEIGGTVGDMEAMPFLEAIRQFARKADNQGRVRLVHLVTTVKLHNDEVKSKPAQRSISELNRAGLWPDLVLCRGAQDEHSLHKIASFADCPVVAVPTFHDVHAMPNHLHVEGEVLTHLNVLGMFGGSCMQRAALLEEYAVRPLPISKETRKPLLSIGILGKYHAGTDSYKSVVEALKHAAKGNAILGLHEIDPETFRQQPMLKTHGKGLDGIVVPGGFGVRGTEAMIEAVRICREEKVPMLGLCLGLQLMAVEAARNLCGVPDAFSQEFYPQKGRLGPANCVVGLICDEQASGGTLRRGGKPVRLLGKGVELYGMKGDLQEVRERFRHRYAITDQWAVKLSRAGFRGWGCSEPSGSQAVHCLFALDGHFHVGVQFHPEFSSRPTAPHPLFTKFLEACRGS